MKKILLTIDEEMNKLIDNERNKKGWSKSQYIRTAIFMQLLRDATNKPTIEYERR